ncbi:HD domain-containing protein [Halocalculus aciditolerans]|uniref:5'-deoxynucleotidase n=1 Tax=Halocalculus aciditolerans TaxID=1383812 RepID=A0A830F7I1_9EURY|nr:HD family hydrolase [Halocalculus aciditolerans]GGL47295.1 phosphohydrolase [Halocalculus aciditolerans]
MTDELERLLEVAALKDETRTGWALRGVANPESVAAHTWGVATLCLLYADEAGVDPDAACAMAVVHDLAEARTGDVPTRAADVEDGGASEEREGKEAREREAMAGLLDPFEGEGIRERWEAYEARDTALARFVKDMDLVDTCLQAVRYEREGRYPKDEANEHFDEYEDLDEFFATTAPRLRTGVGERLFEAAKTAYEAEIGRECRLG